MIDNLLLIIINDDGLVWWIEDGDQRERWSNRMFECLDTGPDYEDRTVRRTVDHLEWYVERIRTSETHRRSNPIVGISEWDRNLQIGVEVESNLIGKRIKCILVIGWVGT